MNKIFLLLLLFGLQALAIKHEVEFELKQHSRSAKQIHKLVKEKGGSSLYAKNGRFLYDNYMHDYIAINLSVGTPPQEFTVSIESGQVQLWILDKDYPDLQDWQRFYHKDKSLTSQVNGSFEGLSGTFELAGKTYTDNVLFKNFVFSQNFGSVYDITSDSIYFGWGEQYVPVEGALGLSWSDYEGYNAPILNIMKALEVDEQIFTIWLGSHVKPSEGTGIGQFKIGMDKKHCDKKTFYEPLGYYANYRTVNLQSFSIGNYTTTGDQATFDTGFPVIVFDSPQYDGVMQILDPDFNWDTYLLTLPCNSAPNLPNMVFKIGGRDFEVPSSQYLVDLDLADGNCAVAFDLDEDSFDQPPYVIGNVFIREYCLTYNIDTEEIGFSKSIATS